MNNASFPMLFRPGGIAHLTLKNRIVMPPMITCLATEDGRVTEAMIDHYVARARGGVGLIVVEATYPCSPIVARLRLCDDSYIPGLRALAEAIHGCGTPTVLQLNPSRGRYDGVDPVAASAEVPVPARKPPRSLRTDEIVAMIQGFGEGARRAREAGFDGIQIHGAQGYLITDFLSPLTNKRDDGYGGDFEGRIRLALELVRVSREQVGADFPIIFRYPSDDHLPRGWGLEEAKRFAQRLEAAGVSALDITAGVHQTRVWVSPPMCLPPASNIPKAREIKKAVHVPVIAGGRIHDPFVAEQALADEGIDYVDFGRALLADPELPVKALTGRTDEICKCIGCDQACQAILLKNVLRCSVNPATGRDREFSIVPATVPRRIVVIGGGPAGMEAARVAALRGHDVTLFESKGRLGGNLIAASAVSFKRDIYYLVEYLSGQLDRLGVRVELGHYITADTAGEFAADILIVATGASNYIPPLDGAGRPIVKGAVEVLEGKTEVGQRAVVVGGGMMACETAALLAQSGKEVALVTVRRAENLAADMGDFVREWLFAGPWQSLGIELVSGKAHAVKDEGLVIAEGEIQKLLPADAVIFAANLKSNRDLFNSLKDKVERVVCIGDCVRPANIEHALAEGYSTGLRI